MAPKYVTGPTGLDLIKGRELYATYIKFGEYEDKPRPQGRILKTYAALKDGPQTGQYLFKHGNRMPKVGGRMVGAEFQQHLRYMVENSRLHVVESSCQIT